MRPVLRLNQGVWIALAFVFALAAATAVLFFIINVQRADALEQNLAAQKISRLSTRMLVTTHTATSYVNESNFRQWWAVHQSISKELQEVEFNVDRADFSGRLEGQLADIAELFSGFSRLAVEEEMGLLEQRRHSVLVDRLISEAEQLAEISYKIADGAFEKQERLTAKRRDMVFIVALLFGLHAFLLLILIRYRVVRPLARIEGVAKEMRNGNLRARCALPGGDELGDVAAALDLLALELESRIADLHSTTHLLELAGRMCGVGAWTMTWPGKELTWSSQVYNIVEADFTHQPTLEEALRTCPGESARRLMNAIEQAVQTGNNLNLELEFRTYKGRLIWVHVFGEVSFEADGLLRKPTMIRGAFLDITERRRAEEDIRRAKEIAESASNAKTDFLSHISHEIRTPLNAIVGLTYILKQSKLEPSQLDFVEKLETAGRGLIELVSGVLDVSKIEAGAMELESLPFSLRSLQDTLTDLMTGTLADKSIEFVVSVESNVPDGVVGDEAKIRQVLVNLAANAIKFTETGYAKVSITLDQLDSAYCVLRFVVQDTGLGMDPATVKRLFQSFTQADSSIPRRFGGSGIGLALSQKLVELMGGTISAVSTPGQGSLFAFSLMLNLDSSVARKPLHSGNYSEVVVVDSFMPQQDSLTQMLEWSGFRSRTYTDGAAAINGGVSDQPTIYLVAQSLPDMTGQEFSKTLKQANPNANVRVALMVQPKSLAQIEDTFADYLVDAVLVKPVSLAGVQGIFTDLDNLNLNEPNALMCSARKQELMSLKGLTVLAVDDNNLNLSILKKILETHGATVILAQSGQSAIDLLAQASQSDVDVCLMDVQMPEMDGLETCEYIRSKLGLTRLPILALTAGVMDTEHHKAISAGVNEVLVKPLEIDKVLDAVRRWGFQVNKKVSGA